MGALSAIGLVLAVLGVGVMIYSRLIRVEHATIPPSKEEIAARAKRHKLFGAGAALSLCGMILLAVLVALRGAQVLFPPR